MLPCLAVTLTTHALVGAAAASFFPENVAVAFTAGFVSHLAIDAIPHWDYNEFLRSFREDKENALNNDLVLDKTFVRDFALIASDGILGLCLSLLIFSYSLFSVPPIIILVGAFAGELPDGLSFLYYKTRSRILEVLQRFHIWIQKGSPINVRPLTGLGLQCVLVCVSILLVWLVS